MQFHITFVLHTSIFQIDDFSKIATSQLAKAFLGGERRSVFELLMGKCNTLEGNYTLSLLKGSHHTHTQEKYINTFYLEAIYSEGLE